MPRKVIDFRDGDARHALLVVAYLRSAGGARFIMAGGPAFRPLTAADDRGARYQISFRGRPDLAEFGRPRSRRARSAGLS